MRPVVLVTGAAGRLGAALCADLAPSCDVLAVFRSTAPSVPSQTQAPLNWNGPLAHCVQADLNRREDIRRLVEVALARFGRVDAIVNSAADTLFHGKLTELWDADQAVEGQLLANCVAPIRLVSAFHQALWKDAGDDNAIMNRSVVNVSSVSGLYVGPPAGQAYYAASKAALNMLTLHLAVELAPYGVRVNALCPGRFRDPKATAAVVEDVRRLLAGDRTGEVLRTVPKD